VGRHCGRRRLPRVQVSGGLTWVDSIAVRPLAAEGGAGGAMLATYCLWSFSGARRDSGACRAVSCVLVPAGGSEGGGLKLAHLHEADMQPAACPTAAFEALAHL
jgi:hypothetical protein